MLDTMSRHGAVSVCVKTQWIDSVGGSRLGQAVPWGEFCCIDRSRSRIVISRSGKSDFLIWLIGPLTQTPFCALVHFISEFDHPRRDHRCPVPSCPRHPDIVAWCVYLQNLPPRCARGILTVFTVRHRLAALFVSTLRGESRSIVPPWGPNGMVCSNTKFFHCCF